MGYEADIRHRDGDREDPELLRDYGFTEEEVRDVMEIAHMYNFTNRVSLASGMILNEEYRVLAR